MICSYCHMCGCEEDCTEFCVVCDAEIKAGNDFCSDTCEKKYKK